jgi:hypothetical protein
MNGAPPLRFLGVVVGGWACVRVAVLAPEWVTEEVRANEAPPPGAPALPAATSIAASVAAAIAPPAVAATFEPEPRHHRPVRLALDFSQGRIALVQAPALVGGSADPLAASRGAIGDVPELAPIQPVASVLASGSGRLSFSGWAMVREGEGSQLAAGGTLGGSQVGARLTYRLTPSLALSGRVSSPLEGDGAEVAVGVEWQPSAAVPVKLLAERRQAIGDDGRSDFALLAHGGVSGVPVAGPVVAEAYAQAGVIGVRDRDLFADGAVKLGVPVGGGVSAGAGAWGAAQPGAARLDVGPQVTLTLPGGPAVVKVAAEWRVRVAGDAGPGSGPALTLSTGF